MVLVLGGLPELLVVLGPSTAAGRRGELALDSMADRSR
jgi:hypothetical protein